MRASVRAVGVEVAFGDRHILKGCDLTVEPGDRVGLVGANGCGKSTFLRILAGHADPDLGEVQRDGNVGYLAQEPVLPGETVGASADDAIQWHRDLLEGYEAALARDDLPEAARLQGLLDRHGWSIEHQIDAMLTNLGAPPRSARIADLSGGERRRVALARALLGSPDTLLLDEPTNHLDALTVEWLQSWLAGYRGALILVTHDRYLLEAVADRIVEIEKGVCVAYRGSYTDYLIERAERKELAERKEQRRRELLAREAEWASRSPAARTGKQKARLKRLEELQSVQYATHERELSLDLRTGVGSSRIVLELHAVAKGFEGRTLMRDVELTLAAGERLGILGPNGCGKSTLLSMLAGRLQPDTGEILRGRRVSVAVIDQKRSGLDDDETVFEAAGNGNDHVRLGERYIHVISYLERFLFPREMQDQKVGLLSGGERARLLLAKTLLAGANLLLLDEPTNDLDLQTLRVLEDALLSYDGALVVVTHDRAFLDRVCTGVLAFEPDGQVVRYAERSQVIAARRARERAEEQAQALAAKAQAAPVTVTEPVAAKKTRLSFRENKELEALPGQIEALEEELGGLESTLADPETYRAGSDVSALTKRSSELTDAIEAAYARWEELAERA